VKAEERNAQIKTKIERALVHIGELKSECSRFVESSPYLVQVRRAPLTRRPIYYVASVQHTPHQIALIAGDVLQNLRSALDHLAYQLVVVGKNSPGPFSHVYFPIADNAEKYLAERNRKVAGMREYAIAAIDAVKPYQGGNDLLWRLHRLNNIDKHRLLIAVGSAYRSVNVGGVLERHLRTTLESSPAMAHLSKDLPKMDVFIKPADKLCPLKAGDELFVGLPDAPFDEPMQFRFEVAFGEQEVKGEPILETLHHMADMVSHLVDDFTPFLH